MNEPRSHSTGQKQAIGCGYLVPPLLGIGIAAWIFRDGIPPAVDGAAPPQLVMASMAVLVSFLIGFVMFVRSRRAGRRAASRDHMTESITADFNRGRRVAKLVFGAFLIFGLAFTIPFGLMLWRMIESRGWEPARCTVVSSEVGVHSGDDGSTYSVDIDYRYRWLGNEYRGDRYNFSFGSSSGYDGKAEVVSRYPVGSEVECWVDPDRPERSVLTRGVGWEGLLILFPLAFVAVGLFGVLGAFGKLTRGGSHRKDDWLPGTAAEEERRPAMSAAAGPARVMPVPAGAPGDPNALEASSTPKGRLIGSIVGAILWNGIVWTVIYFAIIRRGDADGCVLVFMGLFALIGLLILLSVPYYALALANPLLRARIGGVLTPGRSASLSWRFDGRTDRIRRLTITIEGREEARYRKGTSTYTAKNVFYEKVLLEVTDRHAIASGQATIEIPEGTMHSFDGGNNKVIWSLAVEGDIPRWPDVTEKFDITVRPEGLG